MEIAKISTSRSTVDNTTISKKAVSKEVKHFSKVLETTNEEIKSQKDSAPAEKVDRAADLSENASLKAQDLKNTNDTIKDDLKVFKKDAEDKKQINGFFELLLALCPSKELKDELYTALDNKDEKSIEEIVSKLLSKNIEVGSKEFDIISGNITNLDGLSFKGKFVAQINTEPSPLKDVATILTKKLLSEDSFRLEVMSSLKVSSAEGRLKNPQVLNEELIKNSKTLDGQIQLNPEGLEEAILKNPEALKKAILKSPEALKEALVNKLQIMARSEADNENLKDPKLQVNDKSLDISQLSELDSTDVNLALQAKIVNSKENGSNVMPQMYESKEDKLLSELLGEKKSNDNDSLTDKIANAINRFENIRIDKPAADMEKPVINRSSFNLDFIKSIKFMETNNLKELSVKIIPKDLGEIVIRLSMDNGIMKANITASSRETYNLLNSQLPVISNALSEQHISIQIFSLTLGGGDNFLPNGESGRNNEGNDRSRGASRVLGIEEDNDTEGYNFDENSVNMLA